ncbi:MAG TPA: helix-turn-helix transcriptional regulator [Clostridia bacterium]|nr:helix-turn-helix transcriptional regulator [Clostridia bacterium]
MIVYHRFWNTLRRKGISTYALIHKHGVSSSTLARLRRNQPLSTVTLDDLCRILSCGLEDIAHYVADTGTPDPAANPPTEN